MLTQSYSSKLGSIFRHRGAGVFPLRGSVWVW